MTTVLEPAPAADKRTETDSATLHRWYENWITNKDKVLAKYGDRWYRVSCFSLSRSRVVSILTKVGGACFSISQIWLYFLASSVITSRQGGA